MAGITSFVGRFFGRTASEAAGVAAGITVSRPLTPLSQNVENEFWAAAVALGFKKPLNAAESAEIVAQRIWDLVQGQSEAALTGRSKADFDSLVTATMKAPGTAEALELWRRGRISKAQMTHALHKAGLETQYIKPVLELIGERLDPAIVANAIQQGFVDGAGLLAPDTGGDRNITPPVEVVALHDSNGDPVSTEQEAAASGISAERLKVMAELSGNPPGPMELLEMWRREIITETAVDHGIREGRTKTKWTSAFKALKRPLLNPGTLINLLLRGWYDKTEIDKRMALHGYDAQQVQDWYDSAGRPMAPQQAATAFFRGAQSPLRKNADGSPATFNKADFIEAIRRSDIRPEYGEALWDIRFAYPPLFQTNRLVQNKAITPDQGIEWLRKQRYAPEVLDALSTFWGAGDATPKADPWVVKAENQLWATTHRTFIASESNEADATTRFTAMNIDPNAQPYILELWREERALIRKQLTPAQIKKAYLKLSKNYATGANWTRDDALSALMSRGYSLTEANDFLDIPVGK